MIEFQVIESPDENVHSTFKFFQNQLYVGRSNGDLWIQDASLAASHVMLEVIGKDLLVHPQRDVEFYLINGKRASAIRKLKINDSVTIGKTTLKIISFSETYWESKKNILNHKLNELIQNNSERLTVVEGLTKLMKQ